jgi:hypothetical protein
VDGKPAFPTLMEMVEEGRFMIEWFTSNPMVLAMLRKEAKHSATTEEPALELLKYSNTRFASTVKCIERLHKVINPLSYGSTFKLVGHSVVILYHKIVCDGF